MNISFEDLKKTGGVKKEFSYLKPLVDVLKEEYKDIFDKFTGANLHSAMDELRKNDKLPAMAWYISVDELRFSEGTFYINNALKKDEKKEDVDFAKRFKVDIYDTTTLLNFANPSDYCYKPSRTVSLEDLYVVTDMEAVKEEALAVMVKEEEEELKRIAKRAEEERNAVKADNKLRATYGIKGVIDYDARKVIDFLEALSKNDKKTMFTELNSIMNSDSCGCCGW